MSNIYVVGNFKGGVGKSTVVQMLGFESALRGRKTLIVDLDMQGNTSKVMALTSDNFSSKELVYQNNITDILVNQDNPEKSIYNVMDNLDIIPADLDFEIYEEFSNRQFDTFLDRLNYAKEKLDPIFEQYDSVYLDVPPSINIYSKTAMYLARYVIVVLQTQTKSLDNAQTYIDYLGGTFYDLTKKDLSIIGVIPFMLESNSLVDTTMYEVAKEQYGEHLLQNIVLKNERLKRYDATGITMERTLKGNLKMWDKKAHELFNNILDELDEHQTWFE